MQTPALAPGGPGSGTGTTAHCTTGDPCAPSDGKHLRKWK